MPAGQRDQSAAALPICGGREYDYGPFDGASCFRRTFRTGCDAFAVSSIEKR